MAKKGRRLSRSHRAYFLLLPLALLVAGGILFYSSWVTKKQAEADCGCSMPDEVANGVFEADAGVAVFAGRPVAVSWQELTPSLQALRAAEGAVLGAQTDERWIEIDLSEQKLWAHNGDQVDYEFLISGGKWAPTPEGEFRVWIKLRYTKMEGGRRGTGTYYYLPNVPYTQYFYRDYGLHGAYWHHNFGQPMSHGCVNLAVPDAEKLFYWTSPLVPEGKGVVYPSKDNPGTKVVIHG